MQPVATEVDVNTVDLEAAGVSAKNLLLLEYSDVRAITLSQVVGAPNTCGAAAKYHHVWFGHHEGLLRMAAANLITR